VSEPAEHEPEAGDAEREGHRLVLHDRPYGVT
jgi:hypothetical protein